jgi:deoxyribodipyrimidine photolyase-related protein
LIQHETTLRANPRLGPAVLGLARLDATERAAIMREVAGLVEGL